jgi:hypothetical protein
MRTAGPAAVRSWYALFPLSEHPYAAIEKTKNAKTDRCTFLLLSRYRSASSSGIRHYFSNAAPADAVSITQEKVIRPAGKVWRAIPDETGHYWEETLSFP